MMLPTRAALLGDDADRGVRLSPADGATSLVVVVHFRLNPICGVGMLAGIPTVSVFIFSSNAGGARTKAPHMLARYEPADVVSC